MKRVAFKMKLYKGQEDEYEKRHSQLWDELRDLLTKTGIRNYSIFLDRDTSDLFACFTIDDTQKLEALPFEPVMKKWWAYMKDIMETNKDHSPVSITLKEVFYLA